MRTTQERSRPSARRRNLAGLLAAVAALALAVAAALATGAGADDPAAGEWVRSARARAELQRLEEQAAYRRSPAGAEARASSRTAFRRLSADRAADTMRRSFPQLFRDHGRALQLRPGQRVAEYPSRHTAVVEDGAGDATWIYSPAPIAVGDGAGGRRGVDYTPERSPRGWRGSSEAARVLLGATAREGLTLEESGVSLTPRFSADAAGRREGGDVFYANAATDVDLKLRASSAGASFVLHLRSPESADSFDFTVGMPDGARLEARTEPAPQARVVGGDGEPIAVLSPPNAVDAQGARVPVGYEVQGDVLRVRVAHGNGDFAYPIAVDPALTDRFYWENTTDRSAPNWSQRVVPDRPYHFAVDNLGWGNGLNVWDEVHTSYPWGSFGMWYFQARGDSFISRADFTQLTFWDMNPGNACVQAGIGIPWTGWDQGGEWVACSGSEYNQTVCARQPCDVNAGTPGNIAAVALSNGGTTGANADLVQLGEVTLYLGDSSPPTVEPDTSTTAGWMSEANTARPVALIPHDAGLGVKTYGLRVPQVGAPPLDRSATYPCSAPSSLCYDQDPQPRPSFPVDFSKVPEGDKVEFRAIAVDALGKPNAEPHYSAQPDGKNVWTMRVDRSAPKLAGYGGTLSPDGKRWVKAGTHRLQFTPSDLYSGVSQASATVENATFGRDGFSRALSSGWGAADSKQTWVAGVEPDSKFSVAGGEGKMSLAQGVATRRLLGATDVARDVDARVQVVFPSAPSAAGEVVAALNVRWNNGLGYAPQLVKDASGRILLRVTNGAGTAVGGADVDTGLRYADGARYWLRARVTGASPTRIEMKAWQTGAAEPGAFGLDRSDSSLGPQSAARVGLTGQQSASVTALTLGFDNLAVTDLGAHRFALMDNSCGTSLGCPRTPPAVALDWDTSSEAEGKHAFTANAVDPFATGQPAHAVHATTRSWDVGVDRTAPTYSNLAGSLSRRDGVIATAPQTLQLDAADTLSGFEYAELLVDGNVVDRANGDCSQTQCTLSKPATLRWDSTGTAGRVQVKLRVHDYAGNPSEDSWYVTVDSSLPRITEMSGTLASKPGVVPWVADDGGTLSVRAHDDDSGIQKSEIIMGPLAVGHDGFERTVASGWGAADRGGTWTIREGSASNYAVANGSGTISAAEPVAGGITVPQSAQDVDARVDVGFTGAPATAGEEVGGLLLRNAGNTSHYRVLLLRDPQGRIWLRMRNGDGAVVFADQATGITDLTGTKMVRLRARLTGANPTLLRARAWEVGTAEPAAWLSSANDSTPAQQRAGEIGLRAAESTPAASRTMRYDNFAATALTEGVRSTGTPSCDGGCQTDPAPHAFTWQTRPEIEGLHFLTARVTDAAARTAQSGRWPVGLDRTPPTLALSGALRENAGRTLSGGSYNLHVDARDGDASAPETQGSGVTTVRIEIVDASGTTTTVVDDTEPCPAGNCRMPRDWAFRPADFLPGAYTVRVTAIDRVGSGAADVAHATQQSFNVIVSAVPAAAPAGQGLEQWFRYHSTDAGVGSGVHVNLANGNLVWNWIPISDPGRGLSSVVNLTYNSQTRVENTPQYDQVGRGFSLGISGITRVNEPLDLTRAAAGIVGLTDRDGTRHEFQSDDLESYDPPPGVHLHLRRFSAPGLQPGTLLRSDRAWAATRPDGVTYFFDQAGYATWIEDRNGNRMRFEYEYASPLEGDTFADACTAADPTGLGPNLQPACVHRLKAVRDAAGLGADPLDPDDDLPNRTIDLHYVGESITDGVSSARIRQITDHQGRALDFNYTGDGYLQDAAEGVKTRPAAEDPAEQAARNFHFDYEAQGTLPTAPRYLRSVRDPRTSETKVEFEPRDATGTAPRRALKVFARGEANATEFAYTAGGGTCGAATCTTVKNPRGKTTREELDRRGRLARTKDARGTVTVVRWDDAGTGDCILRFDDNQVCQVVEALNTADEATTTFRHNQNGRLTDRVDPVGGLTTMRYRDGNGAAALRSERGTDDGGTFVSDLISLTTPRGNATGASPAAFTYSFDPDPETGNVEHQTDPNGNVADTYFDEHGQVKTEVDWHLPGQPVAITSYPSANYDPNGLPRVMVTARAGATVNENGDAVGGDPTRFRWFYTYDGGGNLRRATDPRGATSGTPDSATALYTTTFTRDSLGRVRSTTTPKDSRNGRFTTRTTTYDANDNVTARVDGNGRQWTTTYTRMDRPNEVSSPPAPHAGTTASTPETTRFIYDANQNVTDVTKPRGAVTTDFANDYTTHYDYDDVDEVIKKVARSRGSKAGETLDLETQYGYDRRGNVTTVRDPIRTNPPQGFSGGLYRYQLVYDAGDRLQEQHEDAGGAGEDLVTEFDYDADGNRTERRDPRGNLTRYTYDPAGRRTEVTDPTGGRTHFGFLPNGRVGTITKPRGMVDGNPAGDYETTFRYYRTGELHSIVLPRAAGQYVPRGGREWLFCRDTVGDAYSILDPRATRGCPDETMYRVDNTFFDTGEVKTTSRPRFWNLSGASVTQPAPEELLSRTYSPDDVKGALPDAKSHDARGSFGAVEPAAAPGILPTRGATTFDYDDEMRLTSVTVAGKETELEYDPTGRLAATHQPFDDSHTIDTTFEYDRNGNLARTTDDTLAATDFDYDQFDRRTATRAPAPRGGVGTQVETTIGYDPNGNTRRITPPRGNATTVTYDSLDRRASVTNAENATTTFGYDDASNLTRVTSPCGTAGTCASGGSSTTMHYDPADRLATSTDPSGMTTYSYDENGNVRRVVSPGARSAPGAEGFTPQIETRDHDARDLPWKATRGTGTNERTTVTEYDAYGNLRRVVNPRGVSGVSDAPLRADTAQLVTPPADAAGSTALSTSTEQATLYEYTPNGQLTTEYMPWGDRDVEDRTRYRQDYTLDARGRVTQISTPHPVDAAGTHTRTSYTHTDSGWILTATDHPASAFGNEKVEYGYDGNGRQVRWCAEALSASGCNDEVSTRRLVTRDYFPSGALKSRTARFDLKDPNRRLYQYEYDDNGNLTALLDEANNRRTTAGYDNADRNTRVNETWTGGNDTRLSYDLDGNALVRETDGAITEDGGYSGGKRTEFRYDSLDREIRTIVHPKNGGAVRSLATSYHPSGERETQTRYNGPPPLTPGEIGDPQVQPGPVRATDQFFYTDDGLLTRRDHDPAGAANDTRDVDYDANGNRSRDARGEYEYNARDQLVEWRRGQKTVNYKLNGAGAVTEKCVNTCTGANRTQFFYASNTTQLQRAVIDSTTISYCYSGNGGQGGDLTSIQQNPCTAAPSAGDVTFEYDKFDRMVRSTGQSRGGTTEYQYDALDRRNVARTGSTATDYSYIGLTTALSAEDRGATGSERSFDYDSDLDRLGTDWKTGGGALQYRSYDKGPDGTVEGLEGADGVVASNEKYEYDPYGADENDQTNQPGTAPDAVAPNPATTLSQAAQDNPFRFQGHYYDASVKSYDMQAREYQPHAGRFTTPDRFESASADFALQADPLTQDRFAFAGGNPVNRVEFDGHGCGPSTTTGPCKGMSGRQKMRWERKQASRGAGGVRPRGVPQRVTGEGVSNVFSASASAAASAVREQRPGIAVVGRPGSEFLRRAPGVAAGFGKEAVGAVAGLGEVTWMGLKNNPVTNPGGFLRMNEARFMGALQAAANPDETLDAIGQHFSGDEGKGRAAFHLFTLPLAAGKLGTAGKLSGLGGAAKGVEVAAAGAAEKGTALVHQSFNNVAKDGFFMGFRQAETLKPGAVIDRYGGEGGRYFSPVGTPFSKRGLPPSAAARGYRRYQVARPLPTEAGLVDPLFGPGLGIQYKSAMSARELVEQGYVRRLP